MGLVRALDSRGEPESHIEDVPYDPDLVKIALRAVLTGGINLKDFPVDQHNEILHFFEYSCLDKYFADDLQSIVDTNKKAEEMLRLAQYKARKEAKKTKSETKEEKEEEKEKEKDVVVLDPDQVIYAYDAADLLQLIESYNSYPTLTYLGFTGGILFLDKMISHCVPHTVVLKPIGVLRSGTHRLESLNNLDFETATWDFSVKGKFVPASAFCLEDDFAESLACIGSNRVYLLCTHRGTDPCLRKFAWILPPLAIDPGWKMWWDSVSNGNRTERPSATVETWTSLEKSGLSHFSDPDAVCDK